MGPVSQPHGYSDSQPDAREDNQPVCVRFWMNGCAQVVHVSAEGLSRYRRDLLATGAVLLN